MKLAIATFATVAGMLWAPSIFAAVDDRLDIEAACPQIRKALPEELGSAVRKFQREGIVEVRMTLRNDRIVDVMPLSGPVRYFAPVRAAVKQLHCHVNEAQDQAFFFRIAFVPDD